MFNNMGWRVFLQSPHCSVYFSEDWTPFDVSNPTIEAMWFQHAKVNPIAPTQFNPHLSQYIVQAILKAMAKERSERHTDVSVFISALHKPAQQYLLEGNELYKVKRYDEALVAFKQAVRLDPYNVVAYHNRGYILSEVKRYQDALESYEQAIRLDPRYAAAYHNMGYVHKILGQSAAAWKCYKKAIDLGLNDEEARNRR